MWAARQGSRDNITNFSKKIHCRAVQAMDFIVNLVNGQQHPSRS
jgi:hypothetical protein